MKTSDIYTSKYLKAGDVTERPESYTIREVEVEEVGRDREKKLVIYFKKEDKGLVCNRTNAKTIEKVLGTEETEDWIGKSIKLYSTEVQFGDEMVEAIRVSLKPGTAADLEAKPKKGDPDYDDVPGRQKQPAEKEESEIPF